MGRPKKKVDEELVAQLASEGASNRDIAAILGVSHPTVAARFLPILTKKRAERRMRLRKAQMDAALAGNATMLVWLGKNELDQADVPASADPPPDEQPKNGRGKPISV